MVHAGLRAAKGFPTKEGPHVKGKHRSVQLPSGPAVAALSVLLFWAVCAFLGTRDAGSELGRTWKRFRIAWVQPVVHPMLVLLMGMSLVSVSNHDSAVWSFDMVWTSHEMWSVSQWLPPAQDC